MRWLKNNKTEIQLIIAFLLVIFGCVLIMMGFWVSPVGIIDASVITTFGVILTFVGALCGIDYHYREIYMKIKKEKDDEE